MYLSRIIIYALILLSPALINAQTAVPGASPTILQGGDNISTAFPIPYIPYSDNGTTTGYFDDYDGTCGTDGGAPDVVYSLIPEYDMIIMISLCQSSNFDTRLYVFEDSPTNVIACNDDECSNQYSQNISLINCVHLMAGHEYYIVIDGYNGASGNYSMDVVLPPPSALITGTVWDLFNEPIPGTTINVINYEGGVVWHDTTTSYGEFEVLGVNDGSYTVEASKPGYITQFQGPMYFATCYPSSISFILEPDDCIGEPSPGTIIEDEPICYDDYNDIYNGACPSGVWDTIPANCQFYGTSGTYNYDDTPRRDTDWLEFDVETHSVVRLTGMGDFYMSAVFQRMIDGDTCYNYESLLGVSAPACQEWALAETLDTGSYWILILPSYYTGVRCGAKYEFSMTTTPVSDCDYAAGDLNHSSVFNGIDVTFAVAYFKGGVTPPYSCFCHGAVWYVEGDFNGDCQFNGNDITRMVGYLKGYWLPGWCPDCPPTRR